MRFVTHSEEETQQIAYKLGKRAFPGMVIALWGELGAGKTAFVKGLAQALDVQGRVRSPSFGIVHEHPGDIPLYHFDLYRLEDGLDEGLDEYFYGDGVCAVEWPGMAGTALPAERLDITIEATGEGRVLTLEPMGVRYAACMEGLQI